jgi:general L-amino acid transport system permease protein
MNDQSPRSSPRGGGAIPFWRDIRVLGVLAQIAFLVFVVFFFGTICSNIAQNLGRLGENQFLCRDGSSSFRCAFDFLSLESQFDIGEVSFTEYSSRDSYADALKVGVLNTIKVSVWGIIAATILGVLAGIARLSPNWLISNVAKWYVDLMRNTPLLVLLFFLAFGVVAAFPNIRDAIQLFGLPVFLSQRGVNLPGPIFMPSFSTWLAFLVLGLVQAQVLWIILGKQEERTGKDSNRGWWSLVAFLVIIAAGWYVAGNSAENQGIMVRQSLRVLDYSDLEAVMINRLPVRSLDEIDVALSDGDITQDQVDEAAFRLCAVRESRSEINFTSQLRASNIPYHVSRYRLQSQATDAYAEGTCDILVANRVLLASERDALENSRDHLIVPIIEAPIRLSFPRIEGLNFVGGILLTPTFFTMFVGLSLYTGGFIAEIVRAGIQSVPRGQTEAGRALGLTEGQQLRLVILPQALRVIIPPLTSQYLNLTKNSSLAIAVAYPDLWAVAYTTLNQSGRVFQVFLIVMGAYLTLSLIISALLNWYNERMALVER